MTKASKLASSSALKSRNRTDSNQNKSNKRRKYTPKPLAEKDKWKKIPPKDGEPTTKIREGRTYHWCTKHQMWCMHTSEECRYDPESGTVAANTATTKPPADSDSENTNTANTLLQQFLSTVDEEHNEEE